MIIQRDSQIPHLCLGDPEPLMLMTELGISNTYIFFFLFANALVLWRRGTLDILPFPFCSTLSGI